MNIRIAPLAIAPLVLALGFFSGTAQAALEGRDLNGSLGSFEAYYDTDLNITWLADANYAATQYTTSGGTLGDADGMMNWADATAWAASLSYGGYTGWRLPDSDTTCLGSNCVDSELGHLFYSELGGVYAQSIVTTHNSSYDLFTNVVSSNYWSANAHTVLIGNVWYFMISSGFQGFGDPSSLMFAWAVHSGDVGVVPEADTWAMLLAGLGLVGVAVRRRRG